MGGIPLLLHALTGCPLPLKVVPLRGTCGGGVVGQLKKLRQRAYVSSPEIRHELEGLRGKQSRQNTLAGQVWPGERTPSG